MTLLPSRHRPAAADSVHSRRKVTWLELFFDLVFVAAVAQVAEPLREHYGFDELLRFTPLFLLIWWAWTGRTMFTTRFDTDDGVQRALTILEMFAVAIMAANAHDSLVSRSSAGFAAAYAGVRVILLVHYLRASRMHDARDLARSHVLGHGSAAALWFVSAVVPPSARLALWMAALAIDLATPWTAAGQHVRTPPHPAHLPERFGLFTLILLGESLVAVMKGIESQEHWSILAATSAVTAMIAIFAIWWWYFDRADATAERHVRTRADMIRLHVWSYAHFPLYLGIIILGVGLQRLVTAAHREPLPSTDVAMWLAGGILLVASLQAIAWSVRQSQVPARSPYFSASRLSDSAN